ncbi:hypothetical protein L596_017424 [Steinernema carpocapsae]|uniref:Uncharacterized protein n=1 Tax=Steinernema carpocapsae TaxID=34508 RepID=A0A4U5N1X3_STECR|nr:hypothetical protein L596_017424 [Steinernema carpocapsae]
MRINWDLIGIHALQRLGFNSGALLRLSHNETQKQRFTLTNHTVRIRERKGLEEPKGLVRAPYNEPLFLWNRPIMGALKRKIRL